MTDSAQRFGVEAVAATLGASTDVDACVSLAGRIDSLFEQAIASFQADGAGIACRAGCSFCCHLRVMVFSARGHRAVSLSRLQMPEGAGAGGAQAHSRERGTHRRAGRRGRTQTNLACGFLVDGKCSAYEARPSTCSGYHSLSKEQCEASFNHGGNLPEGIPVLSALGYVATALDAGIEQGLHAAKLDATRVELNTAVAALIRNPA